MPYIIWEVDTDIISKSIGAICKMAPGEYSFISTSSDKFELIEYVDEKIDLICITGTDYDKLKELVYFFREFNQLLEFIPIIVEAPENIAMQVINMENCGIIEPVPTGLGTDMLLFHLKKALNIVNRTAELREENYNYRTELRDNYERLEFEKKKSEQLLLNILPEETSRELMIHGSAKPQSYKRVSVLFTDFKGFTSTCERLRPEQVVKELDYFFRKFDEITEMHFGEKIKTIGDAYMCAGGIPMRNNSNPVDMVLVGLEMQQFMETDNIRRRNEGKAEWLLRCGIHTGRLIAGVIGTKKFAYDIWGDAVNTASRMESSGEPGKVNISGATYASIQEWFDCTYRGKIYAKNKGEIDMYFVNGLKPEYSVGGLGKIPNEAFAQVLSQL
jgi:class 3 adenylate cyclase